MNPNSTIKTPEPSQPFCLDAQMEAVYRDMFPATSQPGTPALPTPPLIGITGNYDDGTCKLADGYYKKILQAGGLPVVIPPTTSTGALLEIVNRLDGLLLSGGADINPLYAGEEPLPGLGGINDERDLPELLITRLAFNRQLPILGICRGIQTLAIALGGKVHQDIGKVQQVKHSQEAGRHVATHTVTLQPDTLLYKEYSKACPQTQGQDEPLSLLVNSFHHQAVSQPGPHLRVAALAPDGIIESVESSEHKPVLGVQWHPECMDSGYGHDTLFTWLVEQAAAYRDVKALHSSIITLDSHCDTPMFFDRGKPLDDDAASPQAHRSLDFATRSRRTLVDLVKMKEGLLDASIMVAYLPQKEWQQDASGQWGTNAQGVSPRDYATDTFDRVEHMLRHCSGYIALARTPRQVAHNKRHGLKSVMLGIENGLALQGNPANVAFFAEKGVVYITLCHNGDNDLCDSARGSNTHGGLSPLGAEAVAQMNRHGVIADLSHASEKTFYDVLRVSTQPVVCSHSSARALCDHPRNLTDDQMRALAASGGVCQITLYPGFLRTDAQATIDDAVSHLLHAIDIMGIDHVGIGTDFDGDGGVPGLASAAELPNLTRRLLALGLSVDDMRKIWGGNFLRVMEQVQSAR